MQRYFVDTPYQVQESYQATKEMYHHMVHVMRMKVGSQVYLAFNDQQVIMAQISEITSDTLTLVEVAKEEQAKELPVHITIASGYPKGDKLEWIVQKATELGMAELIGFPAASSVVKWNDKKLAKKQERLEKIAQEAAEQSHRQVVPKIELLERFVDLLKRVAEYDHIVIAYEESAKQGEDSQLVKVFQQIAPNEKLLAIFGPEGGITPTEIEQFKQLGGKCCGLGPRILRTETAPLYLLASSSFFFELINQEK